MSKSKYPNQIDTSVELPAVRDNVTQINSSIINSLRSAILNIEKTLGINPQGGPASTVSIRLDKSLDDSGNIKAEAINKMGLLSGPITDRDVSDSANIKESKIKLDYPTSLLYSEISGTFGVLKDVLDKLEEINRSLSSHLTEDFPDRHNAKSINVKGITNASSSTSRSSFEEQDLQSLLTEIVSTHINLNASSVSSLNNAHEADQIFFDSSRSENIEGFSVQSAIEELSNLEVVSFAKTLLKICSNGILRRGKIYDSYSNSEGEYVVNSTGCNYIIDSLPYTDIYMNSPQSQLSGISKMDILKIHAEGSIGDQYFLVKDFSVNNGQIDSVRVFGTPAFEYSISTICSIYKNYYKSFNMASFLPAVRPNVTTSNISSAIVIDPSSATIVGEPLYFQFLNNSDVLNIEIDGNTHNIPLVNPSLSLPFKNIDTAILSINQYSSDNYIPLIATKIRYDSCYAIVLSHMIPNFYGDIKDRYIKILSGTASAIGLDRYIDLEVYGENSKSAFVNGEFTSIDSPVILDSASINVSNLSGKLSVVSGKLSDLNIDKNSFVVIEDYGTNSGAYSIRSMDDTTVTLDTYDNFSFDSNANPKFIFLKNCLNISELEFQEIDERDGEILADIFISDRGELGLTKRLEVSNLQFDLNFSFCISDVSKGFLTEDLYRLNISTDLKARLQDPNGLFGDEVFVGSSGSFKVFDPTGLFFVTLDVFSNGTNLSTQIISEIYGYPELPKSVVSIGRFPYTTSLGKIIGLREESGIPVIKDKRKKGVISESEISESFIEKFIEGPRNEIRGSGIIRGCEIVNYIYNPTTNIAEFDIQPGVVYVNGIRYVYYGQQNIQYQTSLNFYIIFNRDGCMEIVDEVNDPYNIEGNISPYKGQDVLHLAHINLFFGRISKLAIDLKNLDYKKSLDSITVSQNNEDCNFSSIQDALDFCNFSEKIFKNKITRINILEGEYIITEPLRIESYVELIGVGNVSIYRDSNYINLSQIITDPFNYDNCLVKIGNIGSFNFFFSGKTRISNIKFKNNSQGITCSILSHLNYAANQNGGLEIDNCTFEGPDNFLAGTLLADPYILDMPIVCLSVDEETQELYNGAIYRNIKVHSNQFFNSGNKAPGLITFVIRTDNTDTLQNIMIYNNCFTSDKISVYTPGTILAGSYGSNDPNVIVVPFFFSGLFEISNLSETNNLFEGVLFI